MEQLKTPYFVIDGPVLDHYMDMLKTSLESSWGNYQIAYSVKTNSLPWLVKYVKEKGAFAEVVSNDEYLLVKYLGFSDGEIVYNGPYKEKGSFRSVLLEGGFVNMDSVREIDWLEDIVSENPGKDIEVGIRVNFNLERMCPGETEMGRTSGRFGFCLENGNFDKALTRLHALKGVKVRGLHLHSSSKSRSVDIYKSIAAMACDIKKKYDLDLSYVDIGGGYCGGLEGRPEYPDYFPEIAKVLGRAFDPEKTKLIVEPGISLISKCTSFVSSVYDARDIREFRYVMTDGSRFNLDPTMIKSSYIYEVEKADSTDRRILDRQIVSGYTCMETDRMFTIEGGEELLPGDKLIYHNVGGYTMSLNPLFIQYFPPVYVKDGDEMKLVRRKWEPKDYVAGTME
ncbi:MAG: pyridoxal-dependent decarboxylase [Lachnospiraceae bacterium]|nr:pyridoxal-dependent decarboxylase [Lachnospiraceae bacterium]